jgi:Cof subfamily protein (haloacid dehalogenase superfamily)
MNQYQVVVADIDGTLINQDKQLTDVTKSAIEMIKQKGILFGIATGRPIRSVSKLLKKFGIYEYVDFMVCSNGAEIIDLKTQEVQITYQLTKRDVLNIIDFMKPTGINYCIYDQDKMYTNEINSIVSYLSGLNMLEPVVTRPIDLPIETTNKVIFTIYPEDILKLNQHMISFQSKEYRAFFTQPELFEFVDARISKAIGIESFVSQKNIPMSRVVAFGDADNDKEMIIESGLGVAMSNARDTLKAVADDIAKSNEQDGVASYLFCLFSNP